MKKTTKSAFHRGFTLIELMIVIVILGILMGTILPRLSGAQGRARDTGRVADMNSVAQALELYYADFGQYPEVKNNKPNCLTKDSLGDSFDIFKTYFKGENVPVAPTKGEKVKFDTITCEGTYMYMSLASKGAPNQAYALLANTETPGKGNMLIDVNSKFSTATPAITLSPALAYTAGTTTIDDVLAVVKGIQTLGAEAMINADTADNTGESTLYIVASGL